MTPVQNPAHVPGPMPWPKVIGLAALSSGWFVMSWLYWLDFLHHP